VQCFCRVADKCFFVEVSDIKIHPCRFNSVGRSHNERIEIKFYLLGFEYTTLKIACKIRKKTTHYEILSLQKYTKRKNSHERRTETGVAGLPERLTIIAK
jgi:hypothetical protein